MVVDHHVEDPAERAAPAAEVAQVEQAGWAGQAVQAVQADSAALFEGLTSVELSLPLDSL